MTKGKNKLAKITHSKENSKRLFCGETYTQIENINEEEVKKLSKDIIQNEFLGTTFSEAIKVLLNSAGYGEGNILYFSLMFLIKIIILCIKRKGILILGEERTGKSALYTLCIDGIIKISGIPTIPMLRGNANSDNSLCLLKEKVVILEEIGGLLENAKEFISLIKDSFESGYFFQNQKQITPTELTLIITGNNYFSLDSFKDLENIDFLKNLPNGFNDRAFKDRIALLLPHYHNLQGKIRYIEVGQEKMPTVYLKKMLFDIRDEKLEFLLEDYKNNFNERDLKIFNEFIFALGKLCLKDKIPNWFIQGWLEVLQHFRFLLTDGKFYNPFNEKSARLIIEILGYHVEDIEFVGFDTNRIIIKLRNTETFHKIPLTEFGRKDNIKEIEILKSYKLDGVARVIEYDENGDLLIQEAGNYLPDKRIYFDNILKINNEKNKTDEEFNNLLLKSMAKNIHNTPEYNFRGISIQYKLYATEMVKSYFRYNGEVNYEDFLFNENSVKILNFSKYVK